MRRFSREKQVLFLLFILFTLNLFSQSFVEQTGISLPGVSYGSVAWGDYDNDGDLDILLTGRDNANQPVSKIYRNNSDNTFTEQTSIELIGVYESSGVWGDYDNDGDLDILLSGHLGSGVRISKIYRNNGNNSFSEQTGISLIGLRYSAAAWGDYDNDGDLDILLTGQSNSGTVSRIFRNNGDNTFSEQTGIELTGVYFGSVSWGDYDNDGDLDILLTGSTSVYAISKIYSNNGDNTFTEQTGITLTGVHMSSAAWGDYDNDGDLDILLIGSTGGIIISKIYRNNGDNTFTEQNTIALTTVLECSAAWGDYDNDGDPDILLTGYSSSGPVSKIYRNNGDNSFTEQTSISLPGLSAGSIAWGDYDNDSDLDILLTGNTGTVCVSKIFRNETASPNFKPAIPSGLKAITNNGIVTFTWDKPLDNETPQNGLSYNIYVYENGQISYECPPQAFNQADAKNGRRLIAKPGNIQWSPAGYSIKDLKYGKTYNWTVQAVDAGLQGGDFSPEQSFLMPFYRPVTQANCIAFSNIQPTQVSATWTNGGGIKRAVFIKAASGGIADPVDNNTYNVDDITPGGWKCVYNGTGNSVVLSGLVPNTDYLLHVCEYNGAAGNENYLKSAVYQNPVLLNINFTEQTGIGITGVTSSSIAWGDYDNNGYLDILLTGHSGGSPVSKIFRNNGDNTFSEQTGISLTGVYMSNAAWGDYDNDGKLDIVLTGHTGQTTVSKIYRNNGDNTFTEQTGISLTGVYGGSVAWGDYDNDGDQDILLTGNSNSGLASKIYRNNGDNTFTEQTGIVLTAVTGPAAWGDYNNDGNPDILLTGHTGGSIISKIFRNNGNNTFTEQSGIALTGGYNGSIAWADYDNDGDLDILLTGPSDGIISKIYRNNGDNSFTEQTGIALTGVYLSSVAWGDYDNDGNLDLIITGESDNSGTITKIYHNNGNNTFTEQTGTILTGVSSGSVAWGDYDNNGDLDILLTGSSISGIVSKIYRNEILNPNIKPSDPTGLQSFWDNDNNIVFKWNKSTDNTTPTKAISYNLRIGTTPGGNEVKASQALPDGTLLLNGISSLINDTCFKMKLPLSKYYWSVQAVDKGSLASSFAPEVISLSDSIQAKDLEAFIKTGNSILIRWKNGNGLRRALFGRYSSPSGPANPVSGEIYNAEPYFGQGDKIGSTDWYCMFNGKADSAIIYGIDEGYSYDIQVIEYIETNGLPQYFHTTGNANPGVFSSSLFSEQTGSGLKVFYPGNVVWGDYDNDGDLDILLTGVAGSEGILSIIYRNNGDNTFTGQDSIALTGVYYSSAAWGDYDNDGDLDILLTGYTNTDHISKIYRNNGDNTFTEQTGIALTGVYYSSVAWGDYDNDGYLDILLTGASGDPPNYNPVSKIYRNNGNNTFTEQTGIVLTGVYFSSVDLGDYDNDGDLDILLTGYLGSEARISKVYRNNGDNTFTEQTGIGLTGVMQGSVAWGDYDNDSDLDILLTGYSSSGIISKIYRNNGNNTFTEQTGIVLTDVLNSSVAWGDYDNDGDLDILLTGQTYGGNYSRIHRNDGNNTFTLQTGIVLKGVSNNCVAWGDYDNDGDLDLLIGSKVYRNNTFMKAGNYSANKKPSAPVRLLAIHKPEGVILAWAPVKTDETAWESMTYNVRVGKNSGKSDVLTSQSDPSNGYRKIPTMGNGQLDTTFLIRNLPSGKYYWSVQAVDQGFMGGAWSAVDSFDVKNVQTFFSADTVCLGYPTHFTDQSVSNDGIVSWEWDFKDDSVSSYQNPVHTYSASGNFNVKLIITSASGVKDSLEKNIFIKPRPETGFNAPAVCQGIPVTMTNTTYINGLTVYSWKWDFGDGQTSSGQQPVPHGYLNAGDYTVKLKALASNGCADSIVKTVNVGSYPVALVTANAPLTFCKGDSVTLSVPYNSDYIYTWKVDETNLTDSDTSKYVIKFTGNYSLKAVNSKGNCTTTSSAVAIIVKDAPAAPLITESGTLQFCQGDSVVLSVTNTADYTYQWKLNGGAVGSDSSQFVAKSSGTYNLIVSNANSCSVASTNSIDVVVNLLPTASGVNLNGPATFCQGGNVMLSVPSVTGYNYNWRNEYGLISGADINSFTANTSGKYQLDISNLSGCVFKTSSVNVTVKPSPYKPVLESVNYESGQCPGENTIRLFATESVAEYQYQWYKDGFPLINKTLSSLELIEQGVYKLETRLNDCKSESDIFNIVFPDAPEKPMIYAQGPNVWYLTCSDNKAFKYKWYCNDKLIEGADKYFYVANRRMGDYQVSVGNETGCYTRSDVVTIPTGATGINDIDPFEGLIIYPNPTTGIFTIEMDNDLFGELLITIISEQGKEIRIIKLKKTTEYFFTQIDLSGQSKGIYIINLMIDKYFATRKVLVE